jgi:hypothetical protein
MNLRKAIAHLRIKNDLLSVSSKFVLESILSELYDHYKKVHVSRGSSLSHDYFAVDKAGKWHTLEEDCTPKIEALLFGRRLEFTTTFNNISCTVKLHDTMMSKNGLPLILLKFNEEYFAVQQREPHMQHMTLFNFQPNIYGMKCDPDVATQWIRKCNVNEVEFHLNSKILEQLSALWLCRSPRDPPQCVMFVDGSGMVEFLELIRICPSYNCYFLLSGQDPIFAYLQVNDEQQNTILIVPVGSVKR